MSEVTLPIEEPVVSSKGDILWLNTRVLSQLAENKWAALTFNEGKFYLNGKEIKQND
jgi:hypothetical protein